MRKGNIAREYISREVYRELIKKKLSKGLDISQLEKRLIELEEKKWGKGKPGITVSRRSNSSSVT